jgi:uncharacterized protein (TIGR00730 family)
MIELSDSFLSLPGGMGTLDEIFEVLTLRQVGYHSKPSGLLDQMGYYQPLMKMLHSLAKEGFVSSADVDRIIVQPDIEALLDQLTAPANPS